MSANIHKLTLDQSAIYQIKVPGILDDRWSIWGKDIINAIESDDNQMITTITVTVDQATLHGLLRRLYSIGLPLISVIYISK